MSKILCDEIFGNLQIEDDLLSQLEYHYGFFKIPDCIERIISLVNDEQLSVILKHIVSEYDVKLKSEEESYSLREKGNEFFNQGKYEESLWLYNKSILIAPEGKSLAVAVGNRSASLYRLDLFKLCIKDIEYSLEIGYPPDLHPKLFMRLGRCLLNLRSYQKAVIAFRMAEKAFTNISPKQKVEIDGLIETCLSKNLEKESITAEVADDTINIPKPTHSFSKVLPYATDKVHIVKSEKKGRSILAKNDLKSGDIIIVEPAFALILNQQEEPRRCHHCADSVISVIPCSWCIDAVYCSKNCLEEAWKLHHQFECGYKIVTRLGWAPKLALRIIFRGGVNLLKAVFMAEEKTKSNEDRRDLINNDNSNTSDFDEEKLYNGMHGLISHLNHEDPLKRFQFVVAAVIISYFLCENSKWKSSLPEYFQEKIRSGQALELLSTIALQHIAQVAANNFLIRDLWTDEDLLLKIGWRNQGPGEAPPIRVGQRQDEVASAIYLTSSMLNHSCRPNSSHSYYKRYLILKATEDIPQGKEICIHYGQEYSRATLKERRKFLKENCFFECECEACSNPDQFNSQNSRAFCCPDCQGPLIINSEELDLITESQLTCLNCRINLNRKEYFENGVDSGYYRYFKGMKALQECDVSRALWNFLECKKILQKFLYKDNISFAKVLDRIAFCYSKQENFDDALPYLSESIGVLERTYGTESMEVAFELQKMVDVLFSSMVKCEDNNDLKRKYHHVSGHIERAITILELQGGEWFHSLRDLKLTKNKIDVFINGVNIVNYK